MPINRKELVDRHRIRLTQPDAQSPLSVGIGDLSYRRVIAVNPGEWPGDLKAFFDQNFSGIEYVTVAAASPDNWRSNSRNSPARRIRRPHPRRAASPASVVNTTAPTC